MWRSLVVRLVLLVALRTTGAEEVDENDAVIEFDPNDDLFKSLVERESTCVYLYSRKDPQYLAKRKAFRKAAKRDIDQSMAEGYDTREITQWISIDKEMVGREHVIGVVDEEEIDDKKLMQLFGVHMPITFYGFMNMKTSVEFPINASGDHIVEEAAEALFLLKRQRVKRLLPQVNCERLDAMVMNSDQPTIAYFGPATAVKTADAKLSFLKNVHQANLMAFTKEQHRFVFVYDRACIA